MRLQPILIILEQRRIRLFGSLEMVQKLAEQIEEIKTKYESNTFKLNLEPKQVYNNFAREEKEYLYYIDQISIGYLS